jgi:hypothetical protein
MNKRKTVDGDIDNIHHHKRYKIDTTIEEINLLQENNINRRQKRKELMRSKMQNSDQHIQKKICLKNNIDDPNFLFDMVTIPTEYIEHLKESYQNTNANIVMLYFGTMKETKKQQAIITGI